MSSALATAPAAPRASALALMASKINVEPAKLHATLKATVFKGATDEELLALVVVANTYGLNPLLKELYAFPAKGGGIVPVVSVDGWISMVNNHSQMDGMDFEDHRDDAGKLEAITCIIYRKDRNRPIKVTEYLSECRRNTEPWKMENRMLRHKALIQCARVAFGFSGIVDEDEGEDMKAATGRVVESEPVANPFKKERQTLAAPVEKAPADGFVDQPDSDPVPAHVEKTEAERKDDALASIEEQLGFHEITVPQFEALLRKEKLLSATGTMKGLKVAALENIAGSVAVIVTNAAKEEGE